METRGLPSSMSTPATIRVWPSRRSRRQTSSPSPEGRRGVQQAKAPAVIPAPGGAAGQAALGGGVAIEGEQHDEVGKALDLVQGGGEVG